MAYGPAAGLALIDAIAASGELRDYYLMWSARADLLRRLERWSEAAESYRAALARVGSAPSAGLSAGGSKRCGRRRDNRLRGGRQG